MKCFEKNNVPPGYTPVEGSKCHPDEESCAKECGPCWRCYGKGICSIGGTPQTMKATALEYQSLIGENPAWQPDQSSETGLPVGVELFPYDAYTDANGNCIFLFHYESPEQNSCEGSQTTVLDFYVQVSPDGTLRYLYPTGGKWLGSYLGGEGSDLNCFDATDLEVGDPNNRVYIGKTGSLPSFVLMFSIEYLPPGEAKEYQCFDAPPTESGWTPVGDCHKNEEECDEECPPDDTTPPGGRTMPQTKTGPGTELAALLKTFGINAKEKGCQCKSHSRRMDNWGPDKCRQEIETILGWLQTEAKKRKLPFLKQVAKQVVLLAIRRSERG